MKAYPLSRRLSVLVILAVVLLAPLSAKAEAPIQKNLIPFFMYVRDGNCSTTNEALGMITAMTATTTPLFNRNPEEPIITCAPLPAPDGHQLTVGEFFTAIRGRASVKCINKGTHSVLHFSGLLPNGVYSVWLLVFGETFAAGALGTTNPIENFFTASASGEGQLSVTTPEEDLSFTGHVEACWLNSVAELLLVYHSDNQTYGAGPGPTATWVINAHFLFP